MKDESMVEVCARAGYEAIAARLPEMDGPVDWETEGDALKEDWRAAARACLQALLDHEPTKEMLIAGFQAFENAPLHNDDNSDLTPVFRAMISKALGK